MSQSNQHHLDRQTAIDHQASFDRQATGDQRPAPPAAAAAAVERQTTAAIAGGVSGDRARTEKEAEDKGSILDTITDELNGYAQTASNTITELFGKCLYEVGLLVGGGRGCSAGNVGLLVITCATS